jgi:hypothetical protein
MNRYAFSYFDDVLNAVRNATVTNSSNKVLGLDKALMCWVDKSKTIRDN